MATLFVIQGRDQGRRFELSAEPTVLGRDSSSALHLRDQEASRRHAEIRPAGEGFEVVDLRSSNGTFVNGKRVERHTLRSGDRLLVGRTLLVYTGDEVSPGALDDVAIVRTDAEAQSRIVRSVSQEEGSRLFDFDAAPSPWLARARSNLQVMYRTALAVSHTLDIDELLRRIVELIFEWVEADRGCIMLVDRETEKLKPAVRRDRREASGEETLNISRTILEYVMERREGVLTSDAAEDDRWEHAQSIVSNGVREAICVPMQGRYGVVGVIYIDTFTPPGNALVNRRAAKFTEEHLKLMVAIGHQAALAVEDTSYYSAMVQAERLAAMGQTIATLSHHIKNILQGIRGGSFLIDEGLKRTDSEAVRRGWSIVEKNQEKISNLVMDMLAFSKERRPQPAANHWNELAADCVELMQTRASEAQVTLSFEPEEGIPVFSFDADLLHRAVLNVVTNAIDACEKVAAGKVTVRTEFHAEAGKLAIVVEDNGEGIAPEDLQRMFSVFESKKGARGTGLGLPVSRKILREHGGEIEVLSEPKKGSRFTLSIPAIFPNRDSIGDTLAGLSEFGGEESDDSFVS